MSDQPDSIVDCLEGRIYLKAERIYPTEKGLFLCNEDSAIPIPTLHSDQQGCYLNCAQFDQLVVFYKCTNPNCRNVWDPYAYGYRCPKCKSPGRALPP